jgi:hypothetical protein
MLGVEETFVVVPAVGTVVAVLEVGATPPGPRLFASAAEHPARPRTMLTAAA